MKDHSVTERRPRCYDEDYQWDFERIPLIVKGPRGAEPNPVRDSAVFVVHGMGQQAYSETAVQLRNGFEEVLDDLGRLVGDQAVPPPFIYDGYWANYDNFAENCPEDWAAFGQHERTFFTNLWRKRTGSVVQPAAWIAWQALRLVVAKNVRENTPLVRWLTYPWITFLALVGDVYMLSRHPSVLANVIGDVRLYVAPQGVVQRAIVQRIERTVGEDFLRLLGLDWDFRTLAAAQQVQISGHAHRFRFVTWVAHSLSSVISYNVISDLLVRCAEKRELLDSQGAALSTAERTDLAENIRRVEEGLHRFITIGSPLQKFAFLFPEVLRAWPDQPHREGDPKHRHWWVNFFHIWDPVSGRLVAHTYFRHVENLHSRLWRVPVLAHTSYWRDKPVLAYILSRAYGREILPARTDESKFLPPGRVGWYRAISLVVLGPLLVGLVCGVLYGIGWLFVHPQLVWAFIWGWLKYWFGIRGPKA